MDPAALKAWGIGNMGSVQNIRKIFGNVRENLTRFRVVFGYFRGLIGSGSGLGKSGMSCRSTRIKFQLKRTVLDPFREKIIFQLRSL